jgi:hypothetical protein
VLQPQGLPTSLRLHNTRSRDRIIRCVHKQIHMGGTQDDRAGHLSLIVAAFNSCSDGLDYLLNGQLTNKARLGGGMACQLAMQQKNGQVITNEMHMMRIYMDQ